METVQTSGSFTSPRGAVKFNIDDFVISTWNYTNSGGCPLTMETYRDTSTPVMVSRGADHQGDSETGQVMSINEASFVLWSMSRQ